MRHAVRFLLVVVSCVAVSGFLGAAPAPPRQNDPGSSGPVGQGTPGVLAPASNLWFVELTSPPLSEGLSSSASAAQTNAYRADLQKERQDFRNAAAQAGVKFKERFTYENLWNGLSVEVKPTDLLKLSTVAGVANIWPVAIVEAPDPAVAIPIDGSAPELFTAIGMTGADQAHVAGYTGAGIKVAVMDTGIDYNHPDLGGGFGPGYRVVGGYDFVGDAFNGSNTPQPDSDPMDCNGHGTHVSGILGANGGVVGVAPDVTFNAYRVFGCAGSTTSDIMLAAMERVLADGNQILNMSIGSAFAWPNYPTARGSDNLVNRGVVVVCSAGNSGASGLYSMSAPGVGQKSIGSAAIDNNQVHLPALRTGAGSLVGYAAMAGAPVAPTSGTFGIVNIGRACNADLPLPAGVPGNIALAVRGTCTFREKAINALNAGASSVLIYNNAAGIFFGTVALAGAPNLTRPVSGLSQADGQLIVSQLPTTGEYTTLFADSAVPTGGLVSSFSSFGMSPDLTLKPDIAAPGGLIFSTVPLAQGGYGVNSGTSMASPHVAGSAALLLQAHPNTPSQVVRDILQNSASPRLWFGNPGLGLLENTHRQGAGMVNSLAAINATTKVTPGKLSLGETGAGPVTRTITIANNGAADVTYDLSTVAALATGNRTFAPQFFQGAAGVAFSANPVAVAAGSSADVDITFTEPAGLQERSQYGGFIVITPQGGGQVERVPYAGLKGDYQSVLVLNPAASSFGNPLLRLTNTVGASGPVTITNSNAAFILVHLDHQVRRLRLEVFRTGGRAEGRLAEINYVGRNAASNEYFSLAWDGADPHSNGFLGNGTYVVRLSVEKALGDDSNPAHWETWTSPVITIDRVGGGEPQPEPQP